MSGCHGAGAKGCVACKDGYVMGVEEGCEGEEDRERRVVVGGRWLEGGRVRRWIHTGSLPDPLQVWF